MKRSDAFFSSRDLAMCGLFGAAALLLPVLFHALQLGRVFMPMYVPLVALAFLVRTGPAMLTAATVPLLSGALSGMPPFYPPVAVLMAVELALMSALIAIVQTHVKKVNEWLLLAVTLALGRVIYVALVYGVSFVIDLPAGFVAGASFVSGWPGIILMMIVVPPLARLARPFRERHELKEETS